jgi:hypothetical protein
MPPLREGDILGSIRPNNSKALPAGLQSLESDQMSFSRHIFFILAVLSLSRSTLAGAIRYELPELLGEHRYDGTTHIGGFAHVDTPFGFYAADQARLVIVGSVQPGRARGDGVIREALEFDLEPFVQAGASFKDTYLIGTTPTIGAFSFDELYYAPFAPETTPLPNPNGYPPISFTVGLGLSLSFSTKIPPKVDPNSPYFDATDGIIVDEPIIANVVQAYVILSGRTIVPEPSSTLVALSAMAGLVVLRRRRQSERFRDFAALPNAKRLPPTPRSRELEWRYVLTTGSPKSRERESLLTSECPKLRRLR